IIRSDAPIAEASADADPPPGVGSDEANAASRSRTVLSVSMSVRGGALLTCHEASLFDHRPDRLCSHANEIDRRAGDDDGIQLFADLEASHTLVAIDRIRGIDRRADERLLERHAHREACERHRE